jgi:hypothetical protein
VEAASGWGLHSAGGFAWVTLRQVASEIRVKRAKPRPHHGREAVAAEDRGGCASGCNGSGAPSRPGLSRCGAAREGGVGDPAEEAVVGLVL